MEIKEAINDIREFCIGLSEEVSNISLGMAIDALEKQIPKEPTYDGDGYAPDGTFVWDEWMCPNCDSRYEVDYDDYDYCPNCGQRLKWEEMNERNNNDSE